MPAADSPTKRVRFGSYEVDPAAFELRSNGAVVALEPQVFALLDYLIAHRDRVVPKDELLDELWGHRFVSDSALTTQIKSLRRAVGDNGRDQHTVQTVRGQGYRFVAAIEVDTTVRTGVPASRLGNLGNQRTPLFGRAQDIDRCATALQQHRMVTVLGIGGIGKTALAKAAGRHLADSYPDGVWFVDLVPVTDAAGIDFAVANALGLAVAAGEPRAQLAEALRDRQMLLILDNCEHVEDEVAAALDFLLEFTQAPRFLMTSRDPIDLADEWRLFLDPLGLDGGAEDSPAMQSFLAAAKLHGVSVADRDREAISRICARLDGLPLAIELAAAQLRYLTIEELAGRLDRRFELLTDRTRVGDRRREGLHQVLEDTWQLLTESEQQLIAQLAAFPAAFTIHDAETLLAGSPGDVPFAISRCVELGLLSRTSAPGAWWRLLESVRMFALERLPADVRAANASRHAFWCLDRVGADVLRHRHSFDVALWVIAHYDDVVAAQDFLFANGEKEALVVVCSALALAMQLDEGARARAQLDRVEQYLATIDEIGLRSRLHGVAGLCGVVLSAPDVLERHALAGLDAARAADDPVEVAAQLVLVSVRTSFIDPPLALEQMDQAVALARKHGVPELVDAANCFRAWRFAMAGQYDEARALALEIAERRGAARFDNLTFNAVCAVIACSLLNDPDSALEWTERMMATQEARLLWAAQALVACTYALTGRLSESVELLQEVRARLNQSGWDGLPDLLVPAALLARAGGNDELAAAFTQAVREVGQPLQTFHVIAAYRQLRGIVSADVEVPWRSRAAMAEALDDLLQAV